MGGGRCGVGECVSNKKDHKKEELSLKRSRWASAAPSFPPCPTSVFFVPEEACENTEAVLRCGTSHLRFCLSAVHAATHTHTHTLDANFSRRVGSERFHLVTFVS